MDGMRKIMAFLETKEHKKVSALNKDTIAINKPIKADENISTVSNHQGILLSTRK
jgi:hypothetical protein